MAKDSLANAAGTPVTITLKGKKYKASPLTIGDLAEFESSIKSERLKVFMEGTAEKLLPEERTKIITDLCSQGIEEAEVVRQMTTLNGARYLLWRSLSKHDKKLTLDDVSNLVSMDNLLEITTIVQSLGGTEAENPPKPKAANR